jgi:hypothetical protein
MSEQDIVARGRDAWIWPEDQGVRWWTPAGSALLDLAAPCPLAGLPTLRALRDWRNRTNLRVGLAQPLGALIAGELAQGRPLWLHLSRALGPAWQACPFEWLTLDNAPLFGALLVERDAPDETQPLYPVDPGRPIAVLNLLARDEPVQPADAVPAGIGENVQIFDGPAEVKFFLNQVDGTGLGALVVVSHGTEADGAHPFRLPDGSPWALPVERGLPPLVILLACGTDEGNLTIDARRLLDAGAVTVLAPLGRPCPEAAGRFLAAFLPRWRAGARVDEALIEAQQSSDADRGACLLQLIGRGDLRMSASALPAEQSDQDLAAAASAGDSDALGTLIDRLTLRCFQTGQELEQAEAMLRDLLRVRWYDETGEQRLLSQFQSLGNRLWLFSQAWVLPLEALFAEAYDHRRLPELEQARRALERTGVEMPAPVFHYWSKTAYRQGRYALSLQDVARGLALVRPENLCTRAVGLVGHLVNLLVDVDLPAPAAVLHQGLEDCLARHADDKSEWERFKLKDRAARIALRLGQPERALTLYRLKRQRSGQYELHGNRELAWLLYIGAWMKPSEATDLAAEVRAILADLPTRGTDIGPGNADLVYLIRAYAAWAWRTQDPEAAQFLLGFHDLLERRLFAGDAGPPGFVFAYLHLCQRAGMTLSRALPSWDIIATAMAARYYYLELAAFAALLGDATDAAGWLRRVQAQRTPVTPLTFPDWLGDGALADWESLVAARAGYERSILTADVGLTPERLVDSGLLPL